MVECDICGRTVANIEVAIEQEWWPSYFNGEHQEGPVCFECSQRYMRQAEDGELELDCEHTA